MTAFECQSLRQALSLAQEVSLSHKLLKWLSLQEKAVLLHSVYTFHQSNPFT